MFNFKKLFAKKNDGFYLQLEDEDATSKPEAKAKTKESAPPVAISAPATPVTTTAPATAPVAVSAPTAAPATAAVTSADKKAARAEEKAAEKAAKAAKRAAGKTAEAPKAVAPTAPVAAPAPAAPAITNFATDYLIKPSSISGRRMPGANMKGFLDLARQVEKPKAFKAAASERKGEK